jgi:hypothetical protein
MSDAPWYFSQGGAQQGPVPLAQLKQMAAAGQVRPMDLVWQAGMPQWTPAGNVPALFGTGAAPPPLPVLPVEYYNAAAPPGPRQPSIGDDAGMRMLLPVGRSGSAIAAGYMGLFSILVLPAPLALILALIAMRDMKRHPERHGMGRAIFGLIMGLLGTGLLVFGIAGGFSRW